MSTMNRTILCGSAIVVALSLAACGNQSANTTSTNPAPQSSVMASATPAPSNLKITSWGPESTKAGVVFNAQPNGGSALWIRLNQSLDGYEAAVELNATLLQGNISGNLVTAGVPAALYAQPGTYSLRVIARRGARTEQSNDVKFTVE